MLRNPLGTVLVPVDFGPASGRAVALGGYLASASGATLVALHAEAFDVPPYFTVPQIARYEMEREGARAQAIEYLRAFVADHTAWEARLTVVEDRPSEAIVAAAAHADLVIMGTHGRRGPSRWWLGSVAERVVRSSPAPVLVLHEGVDAQAPNDLLARVVVVGSRGSASTPALAGIDAFVTRFQGTFRDLGALDGCDAATLADASLVVVLLPAAPGFVAGLDAGAILRACTRPILFVRAAPAAQGDPR
jgi:nucleotide-binding universal stress UspA family protein